MTGLVDKEREANAEFIIRACNAHEELVEALELAISAIPIYIIGGHHENIRNRIEEVLIKAKGETP